MTLDSSEPSIRIKHVDDLLSEETSSRFIDFIGSRLDRELTYTLRHPRPIRRFIAEFADEVVGVLTAQQINKDYGWLNAARIIKEYRGKGIFNNLRIEAETWLRANGVSFVRNSITSDNLTIRTIFERKGYRPVCFSIEPNTFLDIETQELTAKDDLALVVNPELYSTFLEKLSHLGGNIMVDNLYVPLTRELWDSLLEQNRIYTNFEEDTFLILSKYLPTIFTGFAIGDGRNQYFTAAEALKAIAASRKVPEVIIHAPSIREAVKGVTKAGYSWTNPYSLITYEKQFQ